MKRKGTRRFGLLTEAKLAAMIGLAMGESTVNEAAIGYLRDVLGMEWVPLRSLPQTSTTVQVEPQLKKRVLVVVSQPFTPSDQALLDRMMQAIQIRDYTVSHDFCESRGVALVLDMEVATLRGLKALGDIVVIGERKAIFSHCLGDLREGPQPLVQQRKKITWSHLQIMQSWLQEYV